MTIVSLPAPFNRYSFNTETNELISSIGGVQRALAPMKQAKSKAYQISVKGNKVYLNIDQIKLMVNQVNTTKQVSEKKEVAVNNTAKNQPTSNRLNVDSPNRYHRLPKPFDGYVFDSLNKDQYSLIANRGNGSWQKLLPYRGATYKMWYVVANGKAHTKLTASMIQMFITNGKTSQYEPEETERDTYWVTYDTLSGTIGTVQHKNVIDASNEARQISEHTGAIVHILKLVGVAQIATNVQVKRVAA